jgi:diguanylate cyclase (GGDEF)-like protein
MESAVHNKRAVMEGATGPTPGQRLEGAGLPRRFRAPRAIGLVLGAISLGAALLQHGAPAWAWLAMALQVLAWPHVAYALSSRSATPRAAEYRNLLTDCVLWGFWLPAMGFNVLPSALALTMVTMDVVAVGGRGLLLKGVLAELGGIAVGWLAFDVRFQPAASLVTIVACLPVMIAYPLTVGLVMHGLSTRLADKRRALERSEGLVRHTLDAMEAGIVLYDANDRLLLCNQAFRAQHRPIAAMLQPGQERASVLHAAVSHGLVPEASGRSEASWVGEQLLLVSQRDPRPAYTRELPDGRWSRVLDRRLPDGSLLSFSTDVTDMVQRERELQRLNAERDEYALQLREVNARLELLTQTDALTGVANRRLFDQRLQQEWQRSQRHGYWLSLVMLDVDYFKRFNDHHGHLEGDACLRRVAQALLSCARRTGDVVARYGGEEFALILPHTSLEEATQVAQHCLAAVDRQAIAHGASPLGSHVSISLGVAALMPDHRSGDDATSLVRLADRAMYAAKERGRHRVEQCLPDCALQG